jgi:hypothetical protein
MTIYEHLWKLPVLRSIVPSKESPDKAAKILEARAAVSRKDINDHVLENAGPIGNLYQTYIDSLLSLPNVWLSKYEIIVGDFTGWVEEACRAMRLSPSEQLLSNLTAGNESAVHEDARRHKRQVQPGDHRRKLNPNTVATLDRELRAVLDKLGYDHG